MKSPREKKESHSVPFRKKDPEMIQNQRRKNHSERVGLFMRRKRKSHSVRANCLQVEDSIRVKLDITILLLHGIVRKRSRRKNHTEKKNQKLFKKSEYSRIRHKRLSMRIIQRIMDLPSSNSVVSASVHRGVFRRTRKPHTWGKNRKEKFNLHWRRNIQELPFQHLRPASPKRRKNSCTENLQKKLL